MRLDDHSGQTTAEYAALLAIVAAALAGAGAAAGLDAVGTAVAASVRTGICVVAGDICRPSDAAAAGLEPCTLGERTRGSGAAITIAGLRLGGSGEWTVASRSDGSVLVTRTDERAVGASPGIGIEASPLGLKLGMSGTYMYTVGSGRAWEFPDAPAAARFLADPDEDRLEPVWRFGDAGSVMKAEATGRLGPITLTSVEASARWAAGARTGRGRTTLYFRARADALEASVWDPGGTHRARGPSTGDVMVELTRDAAGLRELGFRTAQPADHGRVVETVARLDLRDPANRDAVAPLLSRRLPWPPGVAADLRAAVLRAVRAGTVERAVYDVRDDSEHLDVAARLGVSLGLEADEVEIERRLVEASAWTPGSHERERVDCE